MTSSSEANTHSRIVRACRNETLDRPPVWLMRQAGRYMHEYQAIRSGMTFLELCKDVDKAVEVSLQPYHAFGMDAVIMFSDILTIPEAMGMELVFTENKGPQFPTPLRHVDQLNDLIIPDPTEKTDFVAKILKRLRTELKDDPDTGLVGFSGAPWTLATYMIEGGGSKNFTHIKSWMYNQPEKLHQLLDMLTEAVIAYLNMQIEAGAQVVQLFDTWGGILPAKQYREFILPYHQKIMNNLNRDKAPAILFVNNSRGLLDVVAEAQPDVMSIDHNTSLTDAREILGARYALQGNLDNNALFAPADVLKPMVESMVRAGGNTGYIVNLGHGILPTTPRENVKLVVDTVKSMATVNA